MEVSLLKTVSLSKIFHFDVPETLSLFEIRRADLFIIIFLIFNKQVNKPSNTGSHGPTLTGWAGEMTRCENTK